MFSHAAAQIFVLIFISGCGNSRLAEQMYNDGFKHTINTDFSPTVIERMKEKYRTLHEMTWEVMDITNIPYDSASCDIILEKGTLDALLVHEKDPWNISTESLQQIDNILQQVGSCIRFLISYEVGSLNFSFTSTHRLIFEDSRHVFTFALSWKMLVFLQSG